MTQGDATRHPEDAFLWPGAAAAAHVPRLHARHGRPLAGCRRAAAACQSGLSSSCCGLPRQHLLQALADVRRRHYLLQQRLALMSTDAAPATACTRHGCPAADGSRTAAAPGAKLCWATCWSSGALCWSSVWVFAHPDASTLPVMHVGENSLLLFASRCLRGYQLDELVLPSRLLLLTAKLCLCADVRPFARAA